MASSAKESAKAKKAVGAKKTSAGASARTKSAGAVRNVGRSRAMDPEILAYHAAQSPADKRICDTLAKAIDRGLPSAERKIWHRHPVWFLDGNPIAGYSKLKDCIRLLFWSGQSFDEPGLSPEGSFKAAEARFTDATQIPMKDLARWLKKAIAIQWDYKNIVKRRGKLVRL